MEGHVESAADQFGDAACRPQVGRETVRGRLLGQPATDLPILFGGQKPGSSRRGLDRQAGNARGPMPGHPLGHSDAVDTQLDGDGGLRSPVENQLNGPPPHGFNSKADPLLLMTTK